MHVPAHLIQLGDEVVSARESVSRASNRTGLERQTTSAQCPSPGEQTGNLLGGHRWARHPGEGALDHFPCAKSYHFADVVQHRQWDGSLATQVGGQDRRVFANGFCDTFGGVPVGRDCALQFPAHQASKRFTPRFTFHALNHTPTHTGMSV